MQVAPAKRDSESLQCNNQSIESPVVRNLLERARTRCLAQLTLDRLAIASAAALGVCVILLIVGTAILDWYWPVAIFTVALAFGVWQARKSMPAVYRIAQLIDHRLGFSDSISTAFHFCQVPQEASAEFLEGQNRQAEALARTADLKAAFPYSFPKSGYAVAGLGLAVLTVLGIRFGVTQSMDMRRPLISGAFESFFSPPTEVAKNLPGGKKQPTANDPEKLGVPVNNPDTDMQQGLDAANDAATNTIDTPDVNANPGGQPPSNDSPKAPSEAEGKEEGGDENQQGGDSKGQQDSSEGSDSKGKDDQKQGQQPQNAKQGNDSKSDLLDKMRDALSNMLNKMKMQPKGDQQQQRASNSKDGNPAGKGQKQNEKGQQPGDQQQSGEGQDQKAESKGENGQKSDKSQGKSGEQQGQEQSADAKSGMGKQDGQKDVKDAELQAAMGKISEIFGKRQQNLTGEVLIEVNSGKQQLKTAYSSQSGAHRESGGEIHRDEVPLMYQQYVERYFEQVRRPDGSRQPAVTKPATRPGETAPTGNRTPGPEVPPRPSSVSPGASQ